MTIYSFKHLNYRNTLLFFGVLFYFISSITAQTPADFYSKPLTKTYEQAFKDIDSIRQLGLTQTQKNLAIKVKRDAIKDGQIGYYAKALNVEVECIEALSEYDEKNSLVYKFFLQEIQSVQKPFKSVAHLYMAQVLSSAYSDYQSENAVFTDTSSDFSSWSKSYLSMKVKEHILNALLYADAVPFSDELLPLANTKADSTGYLLKLSLKAMVAERAIGILKSISNLDKLDLKNTQIVELFAPIESFLSINFTNYKATEDLKQILYLYQILVRESKIYHELDRIKYLHAILHDYDSLYIQALQHLYGSNPTNEVSLFVLKEIGSYYMERDRVMALKYMDEGIIKFGSSVFIHSIKNLRTDILKKEINVSTEAFYKPFKSESAGKMLIQANLRNIDTLVFKVYKVNYADYIQFAIDSRKNGKWDYNNEGLYDFIQSRGRLTCTSIQVTPNPHDYLHHTYSMALPGLQEGVYFMTSTTPQKSGGYEAICINMFSVSKFIPVFSDRTLRIVNATDGKPVKNYPIVAFEYQDNSKVKLVTNSEGLVDLNTMKEYYNYTILPEDGTFFFSFYRDREWQSNGFKGLKGTLITDRAIYRPGQIVSFKGIVFEDYEFKTLKDEKLTVSLFRDGKEISSLKLSSNEFGSVNGHFTLPSAGLGNGDYYLSMYIGEHNLSNRSFRVEEYKRPKFKVEVMAPDSAYKLGDFVTVSGRATAFAGFAIDNAKVVYTVQRQSRWIYGRFYMPAQTTEIESGELLTQADGSFVLKFKAEKPETDKQKFSSYNYIVNVNVKDPSGEVQFATKSITIGNIDREISITGEELIVGGEAYQAKIEVKNLSGTNLPFTGNVTLYKVIKDKEPLKAPLWVRSEFSTISRHDSLLLMKEYTFNPQLPRLEKIRSFQYNESSSVNLILNKSILNLSGDYRLVMNYPLGPGDTMTNSLDFRVLPSRGKKLDYDKNLTLFTSKSGVFQPGETAFVQIRSAVKNLMVYYDISNKAGIKKTGKVQLKKGYAELILPLKEEDRGNVSIHVYSINQYRDFHASLELDIPYSNKKIDLSLHTFRSDLIPGGREIWKVKVNANPINLSALELAAVLYDASLDELYSDDNWQFWIYDQYYRYFNFRSGQDNIQGSNVHSAFSVYDEIRQLIYPNFNNLFGDRYIRYRYHWDFGNDDQVRGYASLNVGRKAESNEGFAPAGKFSSETGTSKIPQPVIRKNFNETAFFSPNLYPDKDGLVQMEFTLPESNTRWHLKVFAHSKDMQLGHTEAFAVSKKQLMVQPQLPRFLREKDQLKLSGKIVNTSDQNLNVTVKLRIRNPETNQVLNWISGDSIIQIQIAKGQNSTVSFPVSIPEYTGPVALTFIALNDMFSDAEEHVVPVLSNRTMVYASLPISVRKSGVQNIEFNAMKATTSPTLKSNKLTVEMSNQPAWLAILSLPYLMNYPNECAEQLFSRIYANSIINKIISDDKVVADYFRDIAKNNKQVSGKLSQNAELKSILLTETPWVLEAKNEDERLQQLAQAFNTNQVSEQLEINIKKLSQMQLSDGSFPWFTGMQGNAYITQVIVTGYYKLRVLGIDLSTEFNIRRAQESLNNFAYDEYLKLRKSKIQVCEPINIGYLYARSFYTSPEYEVENDSVLQYYLKVAKKNWLQLSLLNKAQLAIAVHRLEPGSDLPKQILRSLKENSKQTELMGMYWPANTGGWYWYQSPIETQAAIIEAFSEIEPDRQLISAMQVWLLRNKQTHAWPSTRSTADACYVLLKGGQLTESKQNVKVYFNQKEIVETTKDASGYWKQNIDVKSINGESYKIKVDAATDDFAFGAIHWQYFENMDKVKANTAGLSITRVYYVDRIVNGKSISKELKAGDTLRLGDVVKVVLFVNSDRDLEFVHVKDLRPSAAEPKDVLSTYKWSNTLSYYQSVSDATFNFFVEFMPKGTHQLSYQVSIQQTGLFECGIASAMCLYAPEFSANSSGMKILVMD